MKKILQLIPVRFRQESELPTVFCIISSQYILQPMRPSISACFQLETFEFVKLPLNQVWSDLPATVKYKHADKHDLQILVKIAQKNKKQLTWSETAIEFRGATGCFKGAVVSVSLVATELSSGWQSFASELSFGNSREGKWTTITIRQTKKKSTIWRKCWTKLIQK